jgi:hypothetical protein
VTFRAAIKRNANAQLLRLRSGFSFSLGNLHSGFERTPGGANYDELKTRTSVSAALHNTDPCIHESTLPYEFVKHASLLANGTLYNDRRVRNA